MLDDVELNKIFLPLAVAINKKANFLAKEDVKKIIPKKTNFLANILNILRNKLKGERQYE